MSTLPTDPLYRIFEDCLHSGDYDDAPVDVFLGAVVERYWAEIGAREKVPTRLQEHVRNDLIEDVRGMLRIKIYGSHGVGEYNRRRSKGK